MLFIKWAHVRGKEDIITIGAINYILAVVLTAPFFLTQASQLVTSEAMELGATMGAAYFIAYFFVIYAIRWVGATASTVISVLSLLVPIAVAAWVWAEQPGALQTVGIMIALPALMLIGGQKKESRASEEKPWFAPILLAVFFVLCGLSRVAQDGFRHRCELDETVTFVFAAFAIAAIPSIVVLIVRRQRISKTECLFGLAMGLSNALQTQFILESLQRFPGYIVFPVVSAGSVLFTTLIATKTLGEKLTTKSYVGIVLCVVALVLLGIESGVDD